MFIFAHLESLFYIELRKIVLIYEAWLYGTVRVSQDNISPFLRCRFLGKISSVPCVS